MNKLKKILQSIRIEEYVLFFFSLILFGVYFIFLNPSLSYWDIFKNGFIAVELGIKYFFLIIPFIFFYIFYRIYRYLTIWLMPFCEKNGSLKKLSNPFNGFWFRIKNILINILIILRPFLSVIIFFGFITLILGFWAIDLRGRLIDGWLMEVDKSIFGFYPFLMVYYKIAIIESINILFIKGYLCLGLVLSFSWIIFYFNKGRKLFSKYLIAIVLVSFISLPLWFSFPSNSPRIFNNIDNNQFISQNHQMSEVETSFIKTVIDNNGIDYKVKEFYKDTGFDRGSIAPISTIPSMHVAWAIIIVYYLFKLKKRTIFLSLPWFFFSTFGAVYLGQHYFVDVILSFPLALVVIWLANLLVKIENKYYQVSKLDNREERIKKDFRLDINNFFKFFKNILFVNKKIDK